MIINLPVNFNKSFILCYKCLKEDNEINILNFNKDNNIYKICEKHGGRNYKTIRFCNESNNWHIFYGIQKNAICQSCVLSKRNKTQEMRIVAKKNAEKMNSIVWKDEDYIKRKVEMRTKLNYERFSDPNEKEKQSKVMKRNWENKEFREDHSKRLTERNNKNWQNPEYYEYISQFFLHGNPNIHIKYIENGNNCKIHLNQHSMIYENKKGKYICFDCFIEKYNVDNNNNNNYKNNKILCLNCNKEINNNNDNNKYNYINNFNKNDIINRLFCCKYCFNNFIKENNVNILNDNFKNYSFIETLNKIISIPLNFNFDFIKNIILEFPNAFIQNTFRDQNSNNWSGARIIFENDLKKKNVTWFVYIKFYIKNNINNPIVVGKSGLKGSLIKIDENGNKILKKGYSDVNFSEIETDGLSRKILKSLNTTWLKTHILVIPVNSEKEAYILENYLQDKYNLLGS